MHEEKKAHGFSRRGMIRAAPFVPLAAISAAAPAAESAFSPSQLRLIEALVDRLIPSDESGPGACECGVAVYIGRSFGGALSGEKTAFTAGLAATDALARGRHGAAFAELDAAKKDELLTSMESNEAAGFAPDSRTFFNRVRQLTLEGMFGDPFYGGNRGFAGWDLIRYPGPRMAVSADDQKLREPIKPLRTSAHGGRHGG
jgi:gluconate 2-dehydrogenase gamma chain